LKEIYDPPPVLYVRGVLKGEDELAVAIVGSRKTTPYGKWMTEKLSQELARHGHYHRQWMARGIDSHAHWGASREEEGRSLSVGSGVDVVYPPESRNLYERIIEQGAVLSEFPMSSPPEGGIFLRGIGSSAVSPSCGGGSGRHGKRFTHHSSLCFGAGEGGFWLSGECGIG